MGFYWSNRTKTGVPPLEQALNSTRKQLVSFKIDLPLLHSDLLWTVWLMSLLADGNSLHSVLYSNFWDYQNYVTGKKLSFQFQIDSSVIWNPGIQCFQKDVDFIFLFDLLMFILYVCMFYLHICLYNVFALYTRFRREYRIIRNWS